MLISVTSYDRQLYESSHIEQNNYLTNKRVLVSFKRHSINVF